MAITISTTELVQTFRNSAAQGMSGPATVSFLGQFGYTRGSIISQLEHSGVSSKQATSLVDAKGSELKSILSQIGNSAIPIPGISGLAGGGEAAAGEGAAAGAASGGGAAGAASSLAAAATKVPQALETAGVIAAIWSALTNPSAWLRALEILGAAVAIYLGVRGLAGGYSS